MLVNNKYQINQELGKGAFGKVYQATDLRDTKVAIKYDTSNLGILRHEATMLNYLHQRQCRTKNIPKIYWYGMSTIPGSEKEDPMSLMVDDLAYRSSWGPMCPCLVIPYYDCTLSTYIQSHSFIEYKIASMIQSMLSVLEAIHNVYVIHRDLKPENFMIKQGQVYLIDFGLSTFFVDGDTGKHAPINTEPKHDLVGSPLYASVHVHRGYKASRRDDCIQLGYIWLYMTLGGHLPWEHHRSNQERYYKKQNLPAWFDTQSDEYQPIQNYIVSQYALDYFEKPIYKI